MGTVPVFYIDKRNKPHSELTLWKFIVIVTVWRLFKRYIVGLWGEGVAKMMKKCDMGRGSTPKRADVTPSKKYSLNNRM